MPCFRKAAARRKEMNRGKKEIRLVNGATELGRSERGAEAIAEARDLTKIEEGCSILP